MLPSLVPVLWRYRRMIAGRLTALVGVGYLFVWAVLGTIVFPLGVASMELQMRDPSLARLAPVAIGAAVLLAGIVQLTPWKARHLALCRDAPFHGCAPRRGAGAAWRYGLQLGVLCVRSCAGLTAVLLALGVMDVRVMAAVTAAVTAERLAPRGAAVARAVGVIVVATGLVQLARAAGLG
jgi:predicted metal-binding membrane protein